jgi:hypothetical protein
MTAGSILFTRGEDPLRADKLNAAFAERLLVVGDTMLGPLVLFRDPQVPFEAVTKQYTDALVTSKLTGFLSTTGGTMYGPLFLFRAPQTAMEASTKQYTDAKAASVAAGYLPLTGGTLLVILPPHQGSTSSGGIALHVNSTSGLTMARQVSGFLQWQSQRALVRHRLVVASMVDKADSGLI